MVKHGLINTKIEDWQKIQKSYNNIIFEFNNEYTDVGVNLNDIFVLDKKKYTFEEAMKALERQLDLASIQGLSDFSVIHGKGNGILQQAVQDYLSHYPGVESFSFAPPEEGGTGKTYVHLVKN